MTSSFHTTIVDRLQRSNLVRRAHQWVRTHPRSVVASAAGVLAAGAIAFVVLTPGTAPTARVPSASSPERPSPSEAPPASDMPEGDWSAVQLAPYEPVAQLVADGVDGSRVDAEVTFTLRSLTDIPAAQLAERVVVEPSAELIVDAGDSPDVATVRPAAPLMESTIYRFRLSDPSGALLDEWTFRTSGPVHVVRSVPDTRATQVPTDTGIEFEFDQYGVADIADHFSIQPTVQGSFEQHGRTWAFVPSDGLAPATLYTVRLDAGVGAAGSNDGLEQAVELSFETAAAGRDSSPTLVAFDRPLFEIRPGAAAAMPVQITGNGGDEPTATRTVTVLDLGTASAAMDAAAKLATDRSWAVWSSEGTLDTAGLRPVASFDATIPTAWNQQRMEIPTPLPAGFYLLQVEQEGRPAQLVLQVTDLAAFFLTSEDSAVAWVNDIAADAPIGGATVVLGDGTLLGRTDSAGLLEAPTAGSLDGTLVRVVSPDGREVVSAIRASDGWFFGPASPTRWWQQLGTDRLQYRRDDTIHVWGYIRSRADRNVPADLELRLIAGWGTSGPPVARTSITATARGTLVGELPIESLPPGMYTVALFVAGEQAGQATVTVTDIRKPLFSIDLDSERRAYIAGETVSAQARAAFFDGTTAPGLELRVSGSGVRPDGDRVIALGPDGSAELTFTASAGSAMLESGTISASTAAPEEGSSWANASFAVFPSSVWLEADATVERGALTVEGHLSRVDLAAADAQFAEDGWVSDPTGDPLAGRTVTATVDRVTWKAVQDGTTYDFLEKRIVPTYSYERQVQRIGTFSPVSGADGAFTLTAPFDATDAGAEVTLRVTDEEGREIQVTAWSSEAQDPDRRSDFPYLERPSFCGGIAQITAELGETVEVTMRTADGSPSIGGRTLFVVSDHAGVDELLVTTGAGVERLFQDDDLPSLSVRAVRLTDAGYIVSDEAMVRVNVDDKTIEVGLEADRDEYAPDQEVTLAVTTTGPDGRPIASDVVVQAVDAKLYAIGAAAPVDVSGLMAPTASGFRASYATHLVTPPPSEDGCGATTGGEDIRDEFEDSATFQLIQTGADGRGTATFETPDDLTSWVVTATAFSGQLDAGTTTLDVPVALPFFVDATIASDYLAGEEPIIHLRAYGDALSAGDAVTYAVEAPSLGLETTVTGDAFSLARLPLPELPLGEHELTVVASGPGDLGDGVTRTIRVVPTRLRTLQTAYATIDDTFVAPGGDGLTTHVISDAGRGAIVPLLQQLAWSGSARLDALVSADAARRLLVEEFGVAESNLPASGYRGVGAHLAEGGLALFPHASADLALTARTALAASDQIARDVIVPALEGVLAADSTRERAIVALAGLAAVGEDVLADLRGFDPDELDLRERIWLALGLVAAGDADAARSIERATLAAHGQRLGRWVRLDAGTESPESAETTATMLLLAAQLRDPIAGDLSQYLLDNPSKEYLPALEQIGFAREALEWLPRPTPRFTWSVDGEAHEVSLEPGESLTLTLTAAQRASFALESNEGELTVASAWAGEARYEDLPRDASVSIERTVSPKDHAPADDLVQIRLSVHFESPLESTCYQVTDLVPSGLAPVVEANFSGEPNVISPYEVEGQRVSWCIGADRSDVTLGYAARVVSAGTYRWEPAVIQAVQAPTVGSATPVVTFTID